MPKHDRAPASSGPLSFQNDFSGIQPLNAASARILAMAVMELGTAAATFLIWRWRSARKLTVAETQVGPDTWRARRYFLPAGFSRLFSQYLKSANKGG